MNSRGSAIRVTAHFIKNVLFPAFTLEGFYCFANSKFWFPLKRTSNSLFFFDSPITQHSPFLQGSGQLWSFISPRLGSHSWALSADLCLALCHPEGWFFISKVSRHKEAGTKPAEPAQPRQPPFGPFPEVTNTGRVGRGGAHFQLPSHAPAIQGHLLKLAKLGPWNGAMSFLLLFSSSLLQEDRAVCKLGEAKVASQTRQIPQYTSPTPQHHCSEPLGYPCLYMYILHPCSSLCK